jgi:hypothetical protein
LNIRAEEGNTSNLSWACDRLEKSRGLRDELFVVRRRERGLNLHRENEGVVVVKRIRQEEEKEKWGLEARGGE